MDPKKKGTFTFRTAAVFFILSAIFESVSLPVEVPLFGAVRGGLVAVAYHFIYAALFMAVGVSLWGAKHWGYPAVLVATIYYTFDKLQVLLSREMVADYLMQQLEAHEATFQMTDKEFLLQTMTLLSILSIACWWGFAWYTHVRRDYFR